MGRRSPGEGSVYPQRDSDGKILRWRGAVVLAGKRHTVSAKTRAEAGRRLKALLADLAKDQDEAGDSHQTLAEFAQDWLEHTVRPQLAYNTWVSYESTLRRHVLPLLGDLELRDITAQRVQAMVASLQARGVSATMVRHARRVLTILLNRAVKWRLVQYNPAPLADVPRGSKPRRQDVPVEALPAFRAAVSGHRLEALYLVVVGAGLRLGEALGLVWDGVDMDAGVLRVVQQLQWQRPDAETRAVPILKPPKRQASVRAVFLGPSLVRALRRHRQHQAEERLAAGSRWLDSGLVFTSPEGEPVRQGYARRHLYRLLARAGLDRRCFQELRHSFISLLIREGLADPKTASELAGHASTSITLDVYSHSSDTAKRAAAGRLDSLFGE